MIQGFQLGLDTGNLISFSFLVWASKGKVLFLIFLIFHKDWELPNFQIWLAEIDIESSLDFPI